MNFKDNNENIYKDKFELISDVLKAKAEKNQYIDIFHSLIKNDFETEFCNTERGRNTNDAKAIRDLDYIYQEMKLIANCPQLYSKRIGAMGGSFSSGKSAFINSFLVDKKKERIELAEDVNPTTAIPSYIISDEKSQIKGISYEGGQFIIESEIYKKIDHKFLESFTFDLNKIIKYTIVLTPMKNDLFENICLIDTPGYDASKHGNTKRDFDVAKEYIKDAQFLIWVVNIEKGTIIKSDLEFLRELGFVETAKRPLYIVVNKADKKPKNDIKSILDEIKETLDKNYFYYDGISAYSSSKEELYPDPIKCDILTFLKNHNKPSEKYNEFRNIIINVFKPYFIQTNNDYEEMNKMHKLVNNLYSDAYGAKIIGIDETEETKKFDNGIDELLNYFKPKENKEKHLERIEKLRDKFMDCLDNFCDDMGIERKEVRYCKYCGEPVEAGKKLCSKCAGKTKPNEKICPKCGKKLAAKAKFCSECGADV